MDICIPFFELQYFFFSEILAMHHHCGIFFLLEFISYLPFHGSFKTWIISFHSILILFENMHGICYSVHLLIILSFFPAKTWSLRSWWRGFDNCRKWSTLADKFWEVHILFKEEGVLMYLLYSIYVVACIRFLFPLYLCFHLHVCRWDFLKQDPSIARCKPIHSTLSFLVN